MNRKFALDEFLKELDRKPFPVIQPGSQEDISRIKLILIEASKKTNFQENLELFQKLMALSFVVDVKDLT